MLLVYGANGYTGALIARRARERGLAPVLAGRDGAAVGGLAASLGLLHRTVGLGDPAALDAALAGARVVLHCAGPFARTSRPMVDACLRTGAHYLDITGEGEVFAALAARSGEARARGVTLLPGAGFDVVPSDCLAAHLAARRPGAVRLTLAFAAGGGPSRGTALTMAEGLHRGGMVRRGGVLTPVPAAWKVRPFDFGGGPVTCMTIPWGDVWTAWHSTSIPDIEVYMAAPPGVRAMARAAGLLGPFLGAAPVQRLLAAAVRRLVTGPSAEARARGRARLFGEVETAAGQRAAARLTVADGYTFTARSAVACAERLLAGGVATGFQTPSMAFGADFVLSIEGSVREDVG
jgi:short subunit dehydrogenase-like uncharacterized protein